MALQWNPTEIPLLTKFYREAVCRFGVECVKIAIERELGPTPIHVSFRITLDEAAEREGEGLIDTMLAANGVPPVSNWDVPPVASPIVNLLEFQRELKAMGGQTPVSSMHVMKASGLPEPQSPEFFGPPVIKNALPVWHLREMIRKSQATLAGYFHFPDLGDPKLNPPDDDLATPVIVEADPPR